ncbi:MAG: 3-deoxy-7-phosphoheptulonate synthase [Clostridiales bacterium]|jgi:3-deoxy-7-phosphoheptulonate synthase|nr:3-deoxy-7-phosphoheptulonate synthase [Clostridiales bacterium]
MIIYVKEDTNQKQLDTLTEWLNRMGVEVHTMTGADRIILGLVGDTENVDVDLVQGLDFVQKVVRVKEPYKSSNRKFHPMDTVIDVCGVKLGGGNFAAIAGPCSVESTQQICGIAKEVKAAGASILRGGAFKPRTSPYSFQGLRSKGIELLLQAKQLTGMPIVSEIMDIGSLPVFEHVDIIQVGARNMQNFELLKELGHTNKVILLKRGLANTLKEFLMSAEYIMASGNGNVILCERGIRTFETATRNTLDVSAIPLLKQMSHLPVIADPSHASGIAGLVRPLALAAVAAGADGIMVEVHNDPEHALCDGPQSIRPEEFGRLMEDMQKVRTVLFPKE